MKNSYLEEPILNSELILINNSKKLKENPGLIHESNLSEIESLREEYLYLQKQDSKGLQKSKREIRNKLRDLSSETYTNRDSNLFGHMITTMADKIVTRPQFSGYSMKDEMKSLAITYILLYSNGFDSYKTSTITGQHVSAFSYISTIIFNACIATINKFHKEQRKAKEQWDEHQKYYDQHGKESNISTIGPEYTTAERIIKFPVLSDGDLIKKIKSITINEETEFWIPSDYKINEKEHDFVLKYQYNISIKRII